MSPKHHSDLLCQHLTAGGCRCYMLLAKDPPSLCPHHFRHSRLHHDPEALAAELLASIETFNAADDVKLFLGNLLKQLALKRIQRRDAIALAYISQLLLNNLSAMRRAEAEDLAYAKENWEIDCSGMPRPNRDPVPDPAPTNPACPDQARNFTTYSDL